MTDVYEESPEHEAHESQAEEYAEIQFQSVPVKVINPGEHGANVNLQAADFGAYFSYTVGATDAARQLLPFDEQRYRAHVLVTGTGPVFIGSEAQTKASPALGFVLPTGIMLEIASNQAVWMVPDGTHTATVSVLAERWGQSAQYGEMPMPR
jgi:hypothetical protein